MGALVYIGYWVGNKIDAWAVGMKFPLFRVIFIFLALILAFFQLIRALPKEEDRD